MRSLPAIGEIIDLDGFRYLVIAHVEHDGRLIPEIRAVARLP